MPGPDTPAALITTRLIRPGHDEEFARWTERLDDAAEREVAALDVVRLEQPSGLIYAVHRFRSSADARRWRDAPARRELEAEAEAFSSGCGQFEEGRRVTVRVPSETAIPKWKTWIATWAAVFPLLLALNGLVALLPVKLPMPVELAVTSLIMTATLTWFVLPAIRRRFRSWLLADGENGLRRDPS